MLNIFPHCNSLESVTLGNSITSIGNGAFSECLLTSITIPNSVTSIGSSAFENCYRLSSVTLGSNITSIGGGAFSGCFAITSVTSLKIKPIAIKGMSNSGTTFSESTFKSGTLYVPVGTKSDYMSTQGWKDFNNIVEGNPSGIQAIILEKDTNASVYDLNGRRLKEPRKGINIIGGQKIFVK